MRAAIKIIRGIFIIILTVLILFNVWMLFAKFALKQDPPKLFGMSQLEVTSGSMEPAFSVGDVVIIKEKEDYGVGDVITYRLDGGALVTHRIVGSNSQGFITKGDANNIEDNEIVPVYRVLGEVVMAVKGMGYFLNFLSSPLGLLIIVVVGILLIEIPSLVDRRSKGNAFDDGKAES